MMTQAFRFIWHAVRDVLRTPWMLMVLWALMLASPYFVFGQWSFLHLPDEGENVVPLSVVAAKRIFDLGPGGWAPELNAGTDVLANQVAPGFHGILFLLFPGWVAYALQHIIQYFVGGYFGYRILREQFDVECNIAVVAGLFIAMIAVCHVQDSYVATMIFVIWALHRQFAMRPVAGLVISLALGWLMAAAGGVTITLLHICAVFAWAAFVWPWRPLPVACVLAFGAGAIAGEYQSLVSTLANVEISHRASEITDSADAALSVLRENGRQWWGSFVAPAIALALPGPRRHVAGIMLATAALVIATPSYLAIINSGLIAISLNGYVAPFTDSMPFFALVAQGVAAQKLLRAGAFGQMRWVRAGLLSLALAGLFVLAFAEKKDQIWRWMHGSVWATYYEIPDLKALRARTRGEPPFRVVTPWLFRTMSRLEPMTVMAHGFEIADGFSHLVPGRYAQFIDEVNAGVRGIDIAAGRKPVKDNNRFFLNTTTGLTWGMCKPATIFDCKLELQRFWNLNLLSVANVKYIVSAFPLIDARLELLPSDYREGLLAHERLSVKSRWQAVWRGEYGVGNPIYIYRNKEALARFSVVSGYREFADTRALYDAMAEAPPAELASRAFVLREDLAKGNVVPATGGKGSAALVSYDDDRIVLDVEADGPALLVAATPYSPLWRASIDGKRTAIMPANGAFQAIAVAAGRHRVTFTYNRD